MLCAMSAFEVVHIRAQCVQQLQAYIVLCVSKSIIVLCLTYAQ
jgi:hypothetical protein